MKGKIDSTTRGRCRPVGLTVVVRAALDKERSVSTCGLGGVRFTGVSTDASPGSLQPVKMHLLGPITFMEPYRQCCYRGNRRYNAMGSH